MLILATTVATACLRVKSIPRKAEEFWQQLWAPESNCTWSCISWTFPLCKPMHVLCCLSYFEFDFFHLPLKESWLTQHSLLLRPIRPQANETEQSLTKLRIHSASHTHTHVYSGNQTRLGDQTSLVVLEAIVKQNRLIGKWIQLLNLPVCSKQGLISLFKIIPSYLHLPQQSHFLSPNSH